MKRTETTMSQQPKKRIGVAQAAAEYNLRSRTINVWINRGLFKAIKDPYTNLYFFTRRDFEAFLKKDRPTGRPRGRKNS